MVNYVRGGDVHVVMVIPDMVVLVSSCCAPFSC